MTLNQCKLKKLLPMATRDSLFSTKSLEDRG
jgi:hypothetical protein